MNKHNDININTQAKSAADYAAGRVEDYSLSDIAPTSGFPDAATVYALWVHPDANIDPCKLIAEGI